MAKELKQLAASSPAANTSTLVYTVPTGGMVMANIIVSNEDMMDLRFDILITNTGKNIHMAKSQILEGRSSFESSKMALSSGDNVYVSSTTEYANFIVVGMNQAEL